MAKADAAPPYISDYEAQKLVKLAKDFYANPKNVEAYRQWHRQNYGCWPEDAADGRVRG